MKFQQFSSLDKHIQSSASLKQWARSYLIIHPQREERRKLLEDLSGRIASYHSGATCLFFEQEQNSWGTIHDTLKTPSLFGDQEIVIWNGLKNLSDETLSQISSYILDPSPQAFFLLGAETSKGFQDLYQKTKKELILLDFSDEKPWDKQKRIQQEMLTLIKLKGKTISPKAWETLFSSCGSDPLVLESEIEKIITYVGDRKDISEKDVEKMVSSSFVATGWQLSESLVWGGSIFNFPSSSIDLSFLLALIGQIRFCLNQGRLVGWCLESKMNPEEVTKHYPQLKSSQFQKISSNLRFRSIRYFDEALSLLYEIELLIKNGNLPPVFLFEHLQSRLTHLKQIHTIR